MSRNGMAGLFNVNRSVLNVGEESRQFRLPTMNVFPKLDQTAVRHSAAAQPLRAHESVVLGARSELLPEMTTDVLGMDTGYAIENVRRDKTARPWSKIGLAHLVGRMLGAGQSVTRL
jgi:hypothetical protein